MSYYETGLLSRDIDFMLRVAGCYAALTRSPDPESWANQHMWQVAAAPGFGDVYANALEADHQHPGRDPQVITDDQILAAVQYLIDEETPSR